MKSRYAMWPLLLALGMPSVEAGELDGGLLLRVRLKPVAEARQTQVTLDDLANLYSADLNLLRRAMAIPMGRAPEPGTTLTVRSEHIWRWIAPRLGVGSDKVVFEGPASVVVAAPGIAVHAHAQPSKPPATEPRAVVRGDWATLTAQSGPLTLESRVEVLEDGAVGHLVRVRRPNAGDTMQARVSGPGRVEMPQ